MYLPHCLPAPSITFSFAFGESRGSSCAWLADDFHDQASLYRYTLCQLSAIEFGSYLDPTRVPLKSGTLEKPVELEGQWSPPPAMSDPYRKKYNFARYEVLDAACIALPRTCSFRDPSLPLPSLHPFLRPSIFAGSSTCDEIRDFAP